jgi:hypothetical protein
MTRADKPVSRRPLVRRNVKLHETKKNRIRPKSTKFLPFDQNNKIFLGYLSFLVRLIAPKGPLGFETSAFLFEFFTY